MRLSVRDGASHRRAVFQVDENTMKRYLAERFSRGRWNLCADIDELFDYPSRSKCRSLTSSGISIDMATRPSLPRCWTCSRRRRSRH